MKYAVSACLLGECCRYDGKSKVNIKVQKFLKGKEYVPVCPEVSGGLPTPRTPCEIVKGRVLDSGGEDRTQEYVGGAKKVLGICKAEGITTALLKQRSPSCGSKFIYDGTFSGAVIKGEGICAKLLRENGIAVISEEDI